MNNDNIDNFPSDATNWDYMHLQRLFEILRGLDRDQEVRT